jgi:hypothetical protein
MRTVDSEVTYTQEQEQEQELNTTPLAQMPALRPASNI